MTFLVGGQKSPTSATCKGCGAQPVSVGTTGGEQNTRTNSSESVGFPSRAGSMAIPAALWQPRVLLLALLRLVRFFFSVFRIVFQLSVTVPFSKFHRHVWGQRQAWYWNLYRNTLIWIVDRSATLSTLLIGLEPYSQTDIEALNGTDLTRYRLVYKCSQNTGRKKIEKNRQKSKTNRKNSKTNRKKSPKIKKNPKNRQKSKKSPKIQKKIQKVAKNPKKSKKNPKKNPNRHRLWVSQLGTGLCTTATRVLRKLGILLKKQTR